MRFKSIFAAGLVLASVVIYAQFPEGDGPALNLTPRTPLRGELMYIFNDNPAFTATLLIQTTTPTGDISMPAKIAFLDGKSRMEINSLQMSGPTFSPGFFEQVKRMGVGEVISISRPDKKESYLIYPGLKAYAVMPFNEAELRDGSKRGLKKTEVSREVINGQPATKYKVLLKDEEGKHQEITMWSSGDHKGFPIRIQTQTDTGPTTITFSDVKLGKPDESLLDVPSGIRRHNDVAAIMREKFAAQGSRAFPPPKN
jgi:hypothetical protein